MEQAPDGVLLLGQQWERLVEHYSFFAVFQTPEEFRITNNGKTLGTLPVRMVLAPNMTIVFSGRRWRVTAIHDKVVEKMRAVFEGTDVPIFLDQNSVRMPGDARYQCRRLGLNDGSICEIGERNRVSKTYR